MELDVEVPFRVPGDKEGLSDSFFQGRGSKPGKRERLKNSYIKGNIYLKQLSEVVKVDG
jgi:hypothetical protein